MAGLPGPQRIDGGSRLLELLLKHADVLKQSGLFACKARDLCSSLAAITHPCVERGQRYRRLFGAGIRLQPLFVRRSERLKESRLLRLDFSDRLSQVILAGRVAPDFLVLRLQGGMQSKQHLAGLRRFAR